MSQADFNMRDDSPVQPFHVDRTELYTDFQARVDYLHRFLDFNANDIAALKDGSKFVKAIIPTIAHKVYEKLLQTDITARAFHNQSTRLEEDVGEFYNAESPAIQRRKMFLRWYMTRLCGDPNKLEFWMYLDKVAMMHSGRGRLHALDIEYVHIGVCLGFIQDFMLEAILTDPNIPRQLQLSLLRALTKVLWVQNDFFARWRVREGQEFLEQMEPVRPLKREGTPSSAEPPSSVAPSLRESDSPSSPSGRTSEDGVDVLSLRSASTWRSNTASPAREIICPFSAPGARFETKIWSDKPHHGVLRKAAK